MYIGQIVVFYTTQNDQSCNGSEYEIVSLEVTVNSRNDENRISAKVLSTLHENAFLTSYIGKIVNPDIRCLVPKEIKPAFHIPKQIHRTKYIHVHAGD